MSLRSCIAVSLVALSLSACAYGEASFQKFAAHHPSAELLPVEYVKQKRPADCGAAALTSVGRFWGADIAAGSIVQSWAPVNPDAGYSIGELHDVSERLGLSSSRLLERPDYVLGLVDGGMPVIAPIAKPYQRDDIFDWMLSSMLSRLVVSVFVPQEPTANHYVVVLGADDGFVYMLDPKDGYRATPRAAFVAQWSELTMQFVPDAGENVAALVAYRAPPAVTSFDMPAGAVVGDTISEFSAVDFAAADLTAQGARVRAP
jgi:peptidase C39-like protein